MKKIVIAMMMMLVATSYGVINVNWTSSAGYFFSPSSAPILGADDSGLQTIAQLIYSPDNARDDLWAGAVNDVVVDSITITADGTGFAGYALFPETQNYQNTFAAGWVYAIIYDKAALATSYYYTPTLALEDVIGAATPQGIEMNFDLANGNAINDPNVDPTIDPTQFGTWAVPEPATFLLFGIGGFGAWILRRRQQA